ncbi:MAG: hypothetical protein M3O70_08235 [Actinomycetota bacterium]|nr:hypothetical protein [Actinomycetota bacterium]
MTIEIVGDAKDAVRAFKDVSGAAEGAEGKLGKFGQKMDAIGGTLRKAGGILTAAVSAPLLLAANQSINMAASFEDSANRLRSSLGPLADDTLKWADTLLETHGVGKALATDMVGSFSDMLMAQGKTREEAVALSQQYVKLVADASSYYDLPHEQVQQAIQAGLRGEYEQLEKLNVFLKESDVQKRAPIDTGKAQASQLSETEKAAARQKLIMEGLNKVEGDFAKTADSVNNQARQQQEQLSNLQIEIGTKLIPVKQQLLEWTGKILDKFSELSPEAQNLALKIGAVAIAVGPLLIGIGLLIPAVQGLSAALAWLWANPVAIGIGAVALLAAGLYLAYQRSDEFRRIVDVVADVLIVGFGTAIRTALVFLQQIGGGLMLAAENALTFGAALVGWSTPAGIALRNAREDISRTRAHTNDQLSAIIKQIDISVEAHVGQALAGIADVRAQAAALTRQRYTVFIDAEGPGLVATRGVGRMRGGVTQRQHGGPVWPGQPFLVGEEGPELFWPKRAGQIVPGRLAPAVTTGGGGQVTFAPTFHFHGHVYDRDRLVADIQRGLRDYIRRNGNDGFDRFRRELRRR